MVSRQERGKAVSNTCRMLIRNLLVIVVCAVALRNWSNFQEGPTSFVLNAAEMWQRPSC